MKTVSRSRLARAAVVAVVLLTAMLFGLWALACESMGRVAEGSRRDRVEASPQWRGERFENQLARKDGSYLTMTSRFLFGGSEHRTPERAVDVEARTSADYSTPPASGLRVTWLGHSTLLIEMGARRVLVDPVFGERASPLSFIGPKRFFSPPLPLDELPSVDAVIISHDHYDHLDLPTVRALEARRDAGSTLRWIVPLGVGAHLAYWGVPEQHIIELDWWEATDIDELKVTATPARHFSGRSLSDAQQTLWAGFALDDGAHRVFYSGDTAMHPELVTIGERLGPFDLTLFEVGAYDALWSDVHLGPEQAVRAHQLVRGDVLLPVHWGMFDLALHGWTEPLERVLVEAERLGVRVATPRPGGRVEPAALEPARRWWPEVPWDPVSLAPAFSTAVDELQAPRP